MCLHTHTHTHTHTQTHLSRFFSTIGYKVLNKKKNRARRPEGRTLTPSDDSRAQQEEKETFLFWSGKSTANERVSGFSQRKATAFQMLSLQ